LSLRFRPAIHCYWGAWRRGAAGQIFSRDFPFGRARGVRGSSHDSPGPLQIHKPNSHIRGPFSAAW
jgi:hypothetical protein